MSTTRPGLSKVRLRKHCQQNNLAREDGISTVSEMGDHKTTERTENKGERGAAKHEYRNTYRA